MELDNRTKQVISEVEEIIKQFMFDKYDKIEIEGLDSLIALQLEPFEEIRKCEIQTKVLKEGDVKTKTYVLIIWEDDVDKPLTFVCETVPEK